MAFLLYLAMTAAEIQYSPLLPAHPGYMACHFSPYGTGLSNCPDTLPKGSMLMLNDRTPICGHDPRQICGQLAAIIEEMECSCLLLDFQRPNVPETAALAAILAGELPCPVGVSDIYARDLSCPVFLPPAPPHLPLSEHLAPWHGREIWLEAALDGELLTLTANGAAFLPAPAGEPPGKFSDGALHCHYSAALGKDTAQFTLTRTEEDLTALLQEAEGLGVAQAVGLYQQLAAFSGENSGPQLDKSGTKGV